MKRYSLLTIVFLGITGTSLWAASAMAPDMPDLTLPAEEEVVQTTPKPVAPKPAAPKPAEPKPARPATSRTSNRERQNEEVIAVTDDMIKKGDAYVESMNPSLPELPPLPDEEDLVTPDIEGTKAVENKPVVASTDTAKSTSTLSYKPGVDRDPTLSPDDVLLLKHRKEEELRRIEEERKRRIEAERRRLAELQRQRQLELERLKDPSREIRGKIRINGIIGQEVFIGNKVYTVGKTVLGARIVSVQPDGVVFLYKGQRFTKKIQLQ